MSATPAQIAKAALKRLALAQREPTPDNYRWAWNEEGGDAAVAASWPERARPLLERLVHRAADDPALRADLLGSLTDGRWDDLQRALDKTAEAASAQSQAWAVLIDRVARGVGRGGRQWTAARKKDSLQRVLEGSGSDSARLQQRLRQLLQSWEQDTVDDTVAPGDAPSVESGDLAAAAAGQAPTTRPLAGAPAADWHPMVDRLRAAVSAGLPPGEPRAAALADELRGLADEVRSQGATPRLVAAIDDACRRAERLLAHRHHLVEQLSALCRELTGGLVALAEDESWARGQLEAIEARLDGAPGARSVKAAGELLARTREHQATLRAERDRAREALRGLVTSLLAQLGDLGERTGRFGERLGGYGTEIAAARSIDELTGLVQRMLADSLDVQSQVHQAHARLTDEHARAGELEARVRELEGELRRLSEEVSTDALTQVANRRGMQASFEAERARLQRNGGELAVGLIDIDNFKKLNDTLGHAAGDTALKALAQRVRECLRPVDAVARFGGEEFVVLLPGTPVDEAQQVLTRLQRTLSASLFMHEGREVFVTFSAGVTAYRTDEALEVALERADEALYEAKRTGKNRTCVA